MLRETIKSVRAVERVKDGKEKTDKKKKEPVVQSHTNSPKIY